MGLAVSGEDTVDVRLKALEAEMAELESRLYMVSGLGRLGGRNAAGELYLNANGLNIINNAGVPVGTWQPDGDVFFGTAVNNPPTGVTIAIFNAAQNYNGESVGVGDMLFGNNSSDNANMFWDASAGVLYFRGGTDNQVYVNTNGELVAGAGRVVLNALGHTVFITPSEDTARGVRFRYMDSGVERESGYVYSSWDNDSGSGYYQTNFMRFMAINSDTTPWIKSTVTIDALDRDDLAYWGSINVLSDSGDGDGARIDITPRLQIYGWIELKNTGGYPGTPPDSSQTRVYFYGTKIVFQYKDGSTTRYKYLDLSGTGVTWVHSTTAP